MTPALATLAAPDSRGLGGLVALVSGQERPLPLRSVKVRAHVVGDCCRVEIDQRYANPYDVPLEAVHMLPLPEDGAVVEMELRAGDIVVRADCRERGAAEATFDAARAAGHRAALLTAERADIHTLRVTNLPAGAEIAVRIVVVERLETIDGHTRWRFPTTIAPRYLAGNPTGHSGPGTLPDTDQAPDASRLSPPILLGGGAKLDLELRIVGTVRSVESSLHVARVSLDDGGVRIAPKGGATVDRDFIATWTTAAADRTDARAFTDGAHTLLVVAPPASVLPAPLPRDAVFVIDISGSMEGTKIDAARRALIGALHGLLPNDRFRIVAFDDQIEEFRKGFTPYENRTLEAADAWVARLQPRGGTEMLPAITTSLEGETPAGRVRTVLFITDGQAHNEQALVAAVANRRGAGRFFTLGIDTAVNGALLGRLARVGGGTCELCTPSDDIEALVSRIEARFGMPLAEVKVEGGEIAGPADRALFAGRPVTALLRGTGPVRVEGRTATGTFTHTLTPTPITFPLGALWARERVAELEDRLTLRPFEEEALRGEILRVALAHHIASRFTAFVAVETTSAADPGTRVEVVQPAALPAEWSSAFGGGGGPAGGQVVMSASRAMAPRAQTLPPDLAYYDEADDEGQMLPSAPPPLAKSASPLRRALGKMHGAVVGALATPSGRDAPPEREREALASQPRPSAAPAADLARRRAAPARVEAESTAPAPAADPGAELARTQSADGSYGGSVARTAAALLALVVLGNTRHAGLRKRAVLKAATWLGKHAADPNASVALAALARVERGDDAGRKHELRMLVDESPEGRILAGLLGV